MSCFYLSFLQDSARNIVNNPRIVANMDIRASILLLLIEPMFCLHVIRHHENLTHVPDDIDPDVTDLDLSNNNIEGIDDTSLGAFQYLRTFTLRNNNLRYIGDGMFDNNRFLTMLHLSLNSIEMMPSSFGAAKHSLLDIKLWAALTAKAIPHANFSECIKLEFLNMGFSPYTVLDVSILPRNLTKLALNYMRLSEFPDLRYQTPYLESLYLQNNRINAISSERILGLKYIKAIF